MIKVVGLIKDYSNNGDAVTRAVDNMNFEIRAGEFVAIMGPSGSGKSTLLNILSFLDRPSEGAYFFMDKNMEEYSDVELAKIRNTKMGFIFQSFNLLPRISVYENVELPLLYNQSFSTKDRKNVVQKTIQSVGLEDKISVEAGKLSGGQMQRVAIARALINNPDIIFADEPTGNLDSKSGAQIINVLESLHKSGKTIILVTHETYTAEFADRIIRLRDGRVESDSLNVKKRLGQENFFK